ncbi:MAG TPA: alpha/beta hydrolase [Chitinophagales bacterium]|nr:alpha/beta hydrolase [Chitinophagales bacterium]
MSKQVSSMNFETVDVKGVKIFYREAGDRLKQTIVLLHGFPSSSHEFHDLIPLLANRFHVIAPDYPGMGYSDVPGVTDLRPTFDDVSSVISAFITKCTQGPVILYLFDIGGAIGLRIATANPERIAGLIFQNVTISRDGFNPERLKAYERVGGHETSEKLAEVEQWATEVRDKFLHQSGARQPDTLNPDNWAIDAHAFSNPASQAFMSRLFMDFASNFQHYPEWNAFLKNRQPKALIIWGRNDPLFTPAAPEALKQVLPMAKLYYFDAGHYPLDEYSDEIAEAIIEMFT